VPLAPFFRCFAFARLTRAFIVHPRRTHG
jgi:hypothetical protein